MLDPDLKSRVEAILAGVSVVGPLAQFNLRFSAEWVDKTSELVVVAARHVECVENNKARDFRMAAPIDPDHPEAEDLEQYVLLVVRDLTARAFIHEVDECLRFRAAPLVDPHPGGDFGIRGNYVRWPLLNRAERSSRSR